MTAVLVEGGTAASICGAASEDGRMGEAGTGERNVIEACKSKGIMVKLQIFTNVE